MFTADVRVAHAVRAGAVARRQGRRRCQHLDVMRHSSRTPTTTSSVALARHRRCRRSSSSPASSTIATQGMPLGIDFSGGTHRRRASSSSRSPKTGARRADASIPATRSSSSYGDTGRTRDADPAAADSAARKARPRAERARRSTMRCSKANLGKFEVLSQEIVGPVDRRGPAAARASTRRWLDRRHHDLHRPCASGSRSRSAPSPRRSTTCWSRWRSWCSSATTCR